MNLLSRIRRRLAGWFLRGRVLEAWVNRKIPRLEVRYLFELVRRSRAEAVCPAPKLRPRRQPRRILFISDFQWEGKELVPELQAICPVDAINLHPELAVAHPTKTPAEVVAAALKNHFAGHKANEPDVILFYARPAILSEEAFQALRKACSCPILGMNLDDKIQYLDYGLFSEGNDNYQRWARSFDLNLTNVRAVADWYGDAGAAVYYMPEGYHPKAEPPGAWNGYQREIAFVGSWRAERARLCERLQALGVPVEVFGWGWPNSGEGSNPEAIYRSSMITLGVGFASPSTTLTTLKTRDFECPGAGACYLTTFNWELALHYEIGKEILCYRSVEEIVELFSFYRRRPEECWRMARAAYARCLNEHTWEKRFRKLFDTTAIAS